MIQHVQLGHGQVLVYEFATYSYMARSETTGSDLRDAIQTVTTCLNASNYCNLHIKMPAVLSEGAVPSPIQS